MRLAETADYAKLAAKDVTLLGRLLRGEQLAPYIGLIGYDNLGDELLLQAHEALFPGHKLVMYRKEGPAIDRIAHSFGRGFCRHGMLGGGTLINRQNHWIDRVEALLANHTKLFCIGTGVANPGFWGGPNAIDGTTYNRWVTSLGKFEYVGVRGPISKDILDQGGLKNVEVIGDTALCLTEETMPKQSSKGIVGLCFGDVVDPKDNPMWGDSSRYIEELRKVVKTILASGSKVRIILIRKEDIPSNEAFVKAINHPNCTLELAYDSYPKYARLVQECDVFLGQKLHSTIIALMNRVPSIMIEYRPKCRDFMASVDLEKYVVKTSEFESKRFLQLYDDLQKNHSAIRSKAESKILEYKHRQFERAKKLNELLKH